VTASEWEKELLLAGEGNEWAAPLLAKWADTVADLSICERERDELLIRIEFCHKVNKTNHGCAEKAKAERDEYKRDASVMAATQCIHDMRGDDHGNAVCPLEAEVKALREELADYQSYYENAVYEGSDWELLDRIESRRSRG